LIGDGIPKTLDFASRDGLTVGLHYLSELNWIDLAVMVRG